jgi:hypothetical protein
VAALVALFLAGLAFGLPSRGAVSPTLPERAELELRLAEGCLHLQVEGEARWSRPLRDVQVRRWADHRVLWFGGDEVLAVPERLEGVSALDGVSAEAKGEPEPLVLRWRDPDGALVLLVLGPRGLSYSRGARRGKVPWAQVTVHGPSAGAWQIRAGVDTFGPPAQGWPPDLLARVARWKAGQAWVDRGPFAAPAV